MPSDYKKIRDENILEYGQGTRHLSFLGRLYTDRTHFVFELLQNAEDAGATRILFKLFKDRLEVTHDGRLFDERDVRGVCGVGEGTKTEDLTQIGKFGIGFKSVYAYTATPEIHSGDESFKIESYVRPYEANSKQAGKSWTTLFSFPFDVKEITPETACEEIGLRLRNLSARTLLFLRKIKEIEYSLPNSTGGVYLREEVARGPARQVSVIGQNNGKDEEETWLIFERPVAVPGKSETVRVEISFRLEAEDKAGQNPERIIKVKDSPLIVYFPTEKATRFGFLIQGPYRTTPSRDNIPKDDEWNETLVRKTAELIGDILPEIKSLGLLSVSFLEALPIRTEDFPDDSMFYPIVESVRNALLEEELLPADDGTFVSAGNAKLARGADLRKLLSQAQLCQLFQAPVTIKWLAGEITFDRTPDLRSFLIRELDVEEVTPDSFARRISNSFLFGQPDEWFIDFYGYLSGQEALWRAPRWTNDTCGILRSKPIVKIEGGGFEAPFEIDGKSPRVFLPPNGETDFKIVKRAIYRNEKAACFLNRIGISMPDMVDEVINIILNKYKNIDNSNIHIGENLKDIQKILTAFNSATTHDKNRIVKSTEQVPFLLSDGDDNNLYNPEGLYLDLPFIETGLSTLFSCLDKNSVKKRLLSSKYCSINGFADFAASINIMKSLEICEYNATIVQEKNFSKIGRKTSTTIDADFFINGFGWYREKSNRFLGLFDLDEKISIPLAKAIWLTMSMSDATVLKAHYRPNDRHKDTEKIKSSYLVDYLKSKKWVPDIEGKFLFPFEVSSETLHSDFVVNDVNGWLTSIDFGRQARIHSEEYLSRNNHAQKMGFESVEEIEKMAQLSQILRDKGQSIDRLIEQFRPTQEQKQPSFPYRPVANLERRQELLSDQLSDAPNKEYRNRQRSVRTTSGAIDPITWLRNQYTNESDQMVCQICKEEMPFRKRDGTHYFEKKEVFSRKYLPKEHEAQYLALCPLCAAMYEEFVKNDDDAMADLKNKLVSTVDCDVPITLGDQETSIRFVETHHHDLKVIMDVMEMGSDHRIYL